MLPYLLAFCRIILGFTFAISFLAKVRDVGQFAQTITNFRLLPPRWSRPLALLVLAGELLIVLSALLGGRWLPFGFGLASLLLFAFTIVLTSVLHRRIKTSCHCFGVTTKPVTPYDLMRNGGLLVVTTSGLLMATRTSASASTLSVSEWLLLSVMASVVSFLWLSVGEFIQLLRLESE